MKTIAHALAASRLARLTSVGLLFLCSCSPDDRAEAFDESAEAASALGPAAKVVVRAKGFPAPGVAPVMVVGVNGKFAGRRAVPNTASADFAIDLPAGVSTVQTVDVFFENDQIVGGVDVNLWVDSVTAGGRTVKPGDPGVTYDRGRDGAEFDGIDVIESPSPMMAWSGAMRFKLGTSPGGGVSAVDRIAGRLASTVPSPTSFRDRPSSGPIVVRRGDTRTVIEGLRISNPAGDCITVEPGAPPVTIRDSEIGPCGGHGVFVNGTSGVTVRHNYIHDTTRTTMRSDPTLRDASGAPARYPTALVQGFAVKGYDASRLVVRENRIERVVAGLVAGGERAADLAFEKNYVVDVVSDRTRAIVPNIGGMMVQLGGMPRAGATRITCNVSNQTSNASSTEDVINLNHVQGTPAQPVLVAYNKLIGGGPSAISSTGINLGDDGGSDQRSYRNVLLNAGPVGISVAGGRRNRVEDNIVVHSAYRVAHPWVWPSQLKIQNPNGFACDDNAFLRNRLRGWNPGDGGSSIQIGEDAATCTKTTFLGNVEGGAAKLPSDDELAGVEIEECRD